MLKTTPEEIGRICDALQCHKQALDLEKDPRGAINMFGRSFFPWKALPYPLQHAKLALLYKQMGKTELAEQMIAWQSVTLDHAQRPITSLFLQERAASHAELERANREFINSLGYRSDDPLYVHEQLGFVSYKLPHSTQVCVGSGCKSGMGASLTDSGGIINFGPHLCEMWETHSFGLAGRAENFQFEKQENGFELSYRTRLAAPHSRDTGIPYLQDSGFSGLWIKCNQKLVGNTLTTNASFEGIYPMEGLTFSLYGKGDSCSIAKSHKLAPSSLDRYEGPVQDIDIGGVKVEVERGVKHMEVIPLAGDESFWGADFLISLKMDGSQSIQFTFLN